MKKTIIFPLIFVLMISIVSAFTGNISDAVIDVLEHDTLDGHSHDIISVTNDVYAIFYEGVLQDGYVKTIKITDAGIINQTIDVFEYDTLSGLNPKGIKISDGVFAVVYEGDQSDGFIKTISILNNGSIIETLDTYEYDTTLGLAPDIINIDNGLYAIAYSGTATTGIITTLNITGNGTILKTPLSTMNFDATNGITPSITQIYDDIYGIAYQGTTDDGFFRTFNITDDGLINSQLSSIEFDIADGYYPHIFNIDIATGVIGIAYTGVLQDGYIQTYSVNPTGNISAQIDIFEYDTDEATFPDVLYLDDNVYLFAYQGDFNDGFLKTIRILSNGTINQTLDTFEFDTTSGLAPIIINIDKEVYAVVYEGTQGDGYISTFSVERLPIIEDQNPTSTLVSPANNFNYNTLTTQNIIFTSDATDDIELESMTFYWNITGSIIANGTQQLSGTSVQVYFNRTIIPNATIEWYVEVYDNNTQSDISTNWIVSINQTFPYIDTFNPILSLISPPNNTINGTFPLNITFNIEDDSSNATCILTNSTYIFDYKTILMGVNYVTLQIDNETELSQKFPNLELTCYDNTEANNSATMLLNYTIDKVLPLMFVNLPALNSTFNKVYVSSTPIYTTCYDDNVYRLNTTISNSSDVIFSEEDMSPVANTLTINSILDISELGIGIYQKSDFCADTHTAKELSGNYNIIKHSYENQKGIKWITPSGNEFELKCSYSEGILNYGSYKSADNDRYIFYFIINDTEDGSSFDIECELENKKFPVRYIYDSPYPAHFIMQNNWMDFVLENDKDAKYEVSLNQNNNYVIEIETTTTNLTFGSVGELNTIEILSTIEIVFQPPREDAYVLGQCPVDTLPKAVMFMFFIVLAFVIIMMGYVMKNGLIGSIGSLMLLGLGVYTWVCLGFVSLLMMLLSVSLLSFFVIKGAKAFK